MRDNHEVRVATTLTKNDPNLVKNINMQHWLRFLLDIKVMISKGYVKKSDM